MSLIQARGLTKTYGDTVALDGFDFNAERGRIIGLIGPNGSGKTTALKAILGMAELDSGDLTVLDIQPYADRAGLMRKTAYIADTGILPRWLTPSQLIEIMQGTHPSFDKTRALENLKSTDILQNKPISALSKGMNVQLHLSLILAIDVELLVLDEPTLGLDIIYRQKFYDGLLNDYFEDNRTILITTHEVREIENILTDVVFIDKGKKVLDTPMEDLPAQFSKLNASTEQANAASALGPIAANKTLHGMQYIFRNANTAQLRELGEVSTPNLVELFVACVGDKS